MAQSVEVKSITGFWWVAGLCGVLAIAVGLQLWPGPTARSHTPLSEGNRLVTFLPARLGGGSARDEPIAATEEMKRAVGELLNFTDGIYRIYQLPELRLSVYVAWWEAGRMSPRLVAGHSPDVCWPANGWKREASVEGAQSPLAIKLGATGFVAGESRVFSMGGAHEHVVFWHKVGDEMLNYTTGGPPPWWAMFDEVLRHGLDLRKEQLFVRLSSDKPLHEIWDRPELRPLHQALLNLGLEATGANRGVGDMPR